MKNPGVWVYGLAALAAITACLSGCDWPFESDYRDRLSWVQSVTAPEAVAAGTTFTVVITTSGTNGCWRKGDDRTSWQPLQVAIVPHDREYIGTGACVQYIPTFLHEVPIRTSMRGTMSILVKRRLRASSGADSSGVIQLKVDVR